MAAIFEHVEGWVRQITFLGRYCIIAIYEREPRILTGLTQRIILDTDAWRIVVINKDAKGATYIFSLDLNRVLYSSIKILAKENGILMYDGSKPTNGELTMQYLN